MKKCSILLMLLTCCFMMFSAPVYATTETNTSGSNAEASSTDTSSDSDTTTDTTTDTEDMSTDTTDTLNINSKIMLCDNWEIPTVTYGQTVNIVLPLVNMDKYDITDVIISPVISTDTASFPFEIEKTGYAVQLTELLGSNYSEDPLERRQEVTYTFKARDDISTGYYALNFEATFMNADGTQESATIETYVKTIGKKGSGSNNATSVPRIIVTGFNTVPENVHAGEDFTLTLHMQNTSSNTAVSNIKCDLEAASDSTDDTTVTQAFLPKEGSSTIFIDSIEMGETKDISIDMNAKADLTQRPYVLDVKLEYEDESNNQYTSDASVSIPILQEARFELSDPEVMPTSIEVGAEANIMFSIYNTGKTKMYNVTTKFEAASITGGDTYIGTIETGATGNVDAMVSGEAATTDDGTVKILITYEDEAGTATTVEKTLNLTVTEAVLPIAEGYDEDMGMDDTETSGASAATIIWIISIIVIILAGVGIFIFLKKKKKKKAEDIENELLDRIDDGTDFVDNIYEEDEGIEEIVEEEENVDDEDQLIVSGKKETPMKAGEDNEIS
ncbi:MAG: COG1361 S-layer family protein [Lachnotalea sp.]